MADISGSIVEEKDVISQSRVHTKEQKFLIDSQTTLGDITTVATHTLITIPKGFLFVSLDIAVIEAFVGSTDTVQFQVNNGTAATISGAMTEANLTVGKAARLALVTIARTDLDEVYMDAADGSIQWIIGGTGPLTAGKLKCVLTTVNIDGQTS